MTITANLSAPPQAMAGKMSRPALVSGSAKPNNAPMNRNSAPDSLRNHFLIAMPSLADGIFSNSVTYICEHNEEGAMGLIVNRPLDLYLDEILEQLDLEPHNSRGREKVLAGGPVDIERGFVLHTPGGQWHSTMSVSDDVSLTMSKDILAAIAHNEGPSHSLVALGYASWAAGQLEGEVADNVWLISPADSEVIFHTEYQRRATLAASRIGVDLQLISTQAGHA